MNITLRGPASGLLFLTLALPCPVSATGSVSYAHDEAGRLIGAHYEDGTTINYLYDRRGNLLWRMVSTFNDDDGNGIHDNWELDHFGFIGVDPNAPSASPGMTLMREFLAGTDPNDPDDYLRVSEMATVAGLIFEIEWAATPGKIYRVQYNDTLHPADWRDLPGDILAAETRASKTDETIADADKRFYRVLVLQ